MTVAFCRSTDYIALRVPKCLWDVCLCVHAASVCVHMCAVYVCVCMCMCMFVCVCVWEVRGGGGCTTEYLLNMTVVLMSYFVFCL